MSATLAALEQKFAVLDKLPESLYATVIVHPHGELLSRAEGIMQWRAALLQGHLPEMDKLNWPDPELRLVVLKRLEVLEIVQYCRQQEALTDSVLLDICEGISSAEEYYHYKPGGFVDKLAQRQKIRDRDSPFEDEEGLADHVENNFPSEQDQTQPDAASDDPGQQTQPNLDQQDQAERSQNQTGRPEPTGPATPGTDHAAPMEPQTAGGLNDPLAANDVHAKTDTDSTAADQDLHASAQLPHSSLAAEPVITQDSNDGAGQQAETNTQADKSVQDFSAMNLQLAPADIPTGETEKPAAEQLDQQLQQRWQELAEHWHEMEAIFSSLSGHLGKGWDLTQGMLSAQGWRDIIRYRKLVKNSSQLRALVKTLGRFREISGQVQPSDAIEQIFTPLGRLTRQPEEVITPRVVMETGGLERSDDLARQLPSELAMLGHPKLKMLWHARRAERLLMSYAYRGLATDTECAQESQQNESEEQSPRSDLGLGPIIVCLDTSGSMQGEPEHIAKALVLEALIIASKENRACYVFSFGGPQEIIEHELNLSEGGLNRLLDFLQMSFHGGTDVTAPLMKAMQRQQQQGWEKADILLVSDGRFPTQADLFSRLQKTKQRQGLRVHGLLLGNWRSSAIEQICEPLHRFSDWQEIPAGLH